MFVCSGVLNFRIYCFSLSFLEVNEESLGFYITVRVKSQFEDVTMVMSIIHYF